MQAVTTPMVVILEVISLLVSLLLRPGHKLVVRLFTDRQLLVLTLPSGLPGLGDRQRQLLR